jgi:hypothetical protein
VVCCPGRFAVLGLLEVAGRIDSAGPVARLRDETAPTGLELLAMPVTTIAIQVITMAIPAITMIRSRRSR